MVHDVVDEEQDCERQVKDVAGEQALAGRVLLLELGDDAGILKDFFFKMGTTRSS